MIVIECLYARNIIKRMLAGMTTLIGPVAPLCCLPRRAYHRHRHWLQARETLQSMKSYTFRDLDPVFDGTYEFRRLIRIAQDEMNFRTVIRVLCRREGDRHENKFFRDSPRINPPAGIPHTAVQAYSCQANARGDGADAAPGPASPGVRTEAWGHRPPRECPHGRQYGTRE